MLDHIWKNYERGVLTNGHLCIIFAAGLELTMGTMCNMLDLFDERERSQRHRYTDK